ncbi:hypothetical protein [Allorhizocola rhizosphaerae]|uniref:hypothetical protein n=1 Tax=Allorhizocola rhizosphaerae TaxID=1872709 RepID=UPI000E3DC4C3|nr:hypothetical protein [Allorhizocola rhizosphaerae]
MAIGRFFAVLFGVRPHLRELTREAQDWYAREWLALQARFADAPAETLGAADELVSRLIADRRAGHIRQDADYRAAHDIARRRDAGPAERKRAMSRFHTVVSELLI